jgi:WS/DGAT/MGAT family acyltransferase
MPLDRLSAEDQLMLQASGIWPQEIGVLALLEGGALLDPSGRLRIESVREAIQSRLHLAPRFRQLIYQPPRGQGAPLWVDAHHFEVREHVRILPLPTPGGEGELLLAVEQLRRQRLDPSRPLWEMWFLTGLPERRIAMFVKTHHAMADGLAAMATITAFLDAVPDAPGAAPRPWTAAPPPSARQLFADNLLRQAKGLVAALSVLLRPRSTVRQLRAAWPATRELIAEEPAPETSLHRMVGADRKLAMIRSRADLVREVAHAHHATVNDLLLTLIAGGLRALLRSRGEPVEGLTLKIYVPVTLRRRLRGSLQGNHIAQMVVPLPVGEPDPGRRLEQIAVETTERKARARANVATLFRGRLATRLMLKAITRQRVDVTTASLPGPKRPLYLAGARVLEVFPVVPLIGNVALGVGGVTYAGTYNIGVTADRDAYPDLDLFSSGMRDELDALSAAWNSERGARVPAA